MAVEVNRDHLAALRQHDSAMKWFPENDRGIELNGTLNLIEWSATSPFGVGRAAFSEGVRAGMGRAGAVEPVSGPAGGACLIPDFDVRAALGKKGTRTMNRLTGMAVITVGQLLGAMDEEVPAEELGLVLGTTVGSAQSAMDFVRASLTADEPFRVESGLIPYAVINGSAGQCAIWHKLRGPNATVAAGRAAGLLALNYARRLLLTGRARTVLAGSAEEYSEARHWIARAAGETADPLGEGCAMFALTNSPVAEPIAEIHAIQVMNCTDGDWRAVVRMCVDRVLATAGIEAARVRLACPSGAPNELGDGELAALGEILPDAVLLEPIGRLIGETHAVSAAFQLAAVLSVADRDPSLAGGFAVVTSVDDSGTTAAALLRLR
ncbi:beta-ketoacyl synthase N-terminal-like domain-containing protein [Nocardia noduli]|uniref:beta-ketoacyl synthase N-terminal-like domain-containing protein n=1 Tax=Nocardia noduli TaxID=2815722 RepID=UPI001C240493|nr:beta-ketoacyl synthase N-terminal-like domain-containing protein [Nocardia noduli]